MNEKWFKIVTTLIWLVATAIFIAAVYIACVSEATPLFFKILVTCGFIAEEIWMTLAWVDGLGG